MPIVFLTSYGDIPITVQAMKAGAIEFFMKPLNEERMLSTMGRAMEASRAKLEQETELLALHERHSSLSTREQEVMGQPDLKASDVPLVTFKISIKPDDDEEP